MGLLLKLVAVLAVLAAACCAQTAVTTYHNDNSRTGQYLSEPLLTPVNVAPGQFGKRFSYPVDGAVYAQPLYLPRIVINGALHDVVFVATAHDSLYAFDADSPGVNETPLWQVSFLNGAQNVTSVPEADVNCPVITPELGITGTPVIDPVAGIIYVIAETKEAGPSYVFRLHALNVATGAEQPGSPVVIDATDFVPLTYKQRGALLLANGLVYSEWSSHCDHGDYHGFIMSHDATTLNPVAVYNVTPGANGGSFWNAGGGPAADAAGNPFVVSANGDFDSNSGVYGDSVIRLDPQQLTVNDSFTPYDQLILAENDLDLGSSGAVLLPDSAGSAAHPHTLAVAGKEGRLYLLDRDHLGGTQISSDVDALASGLVLQHATFGSAAWFNGRIYVASELSPIRSFAISGATLNTTPAAESSEVFPSLGGVPSISANGAAGGLLWINNYDGEAELQCFDAGTLNKLYDNADVTADQAGPWEEFNVPTVANSKVYLGTGDNLSAYGELNAATPVVAGVVNAASYAGSAVSPGSLVSIFGSQLSLITGATGGLPLPIAFADVIVTVNGLPTPLLYVSPAQINAQIPSGVATGTAQMVITVAGAASAAFPFNVQPSAPGVFQASAGEGAAALNQDGTLNTAGNPAVPGSVISIYLTGVTALESLAIDGEPAPVNGPYPGTAAVTATVGSAAATVQYAGPAPGFVGLIQVNLQIPALAAGTYPLVISADDVPSNTTQIYVQSE